MKKRKPVFLDGASNTPLDKRVYAAMKPYLRESFVGNSASSHDCGVTAFLAIEEARKKVSMAIGTLASSVYFTSGATESNNWVVWSTARYQLTHGMKRNRIVCCSTEHSSVLNSCKSLLSLGFDVVFADPDQSGRISSVAHLVNDKTCLVCIMATNNETGLSNNVNGVCLEAMKYDAPVLVDCTQEIALGGNSVRICSTYPYASFYTFSGHKFYGPTGVGCLVVGADTKIGPMLFGGSQERGHRGGTSNTAGIVGIGAAIDLIQKQSLTPHYVNLVSYVAQRLISTGLGVFNFIPDHPNIISIDFSRSVSVDNLAAVLSNYGICVSAGSACDAEISDIDEFNPSHVLVALGFHEEKIRNTIRVSFTKYTQKRDIDRLFSAIQDIIKV